MSSLVGAEKIARFLSLSEHKNTYFEELCGVVICSDCDSAVIGWNGEIGRVDCPAYRRKRQRTKAASATEHAGEYAICNTESEFEHAKETDCQYSSDTTTGG